MKRIMACLTALLLLCSVAAAEGNTAKKQLTVGNPTPMRGEFFTNLWGNATSDIDVRDLLHGYNLAMWDGDLGSFKINPTVVSGVESGKDDMGNMVYTLYLQRDLKYSDGTPITAWDYAFSWLFMLSPEAAETGAVVRRADQFLGYERYISGRARNLQGVQVYSDYVLKVIIRKAYVPFFHEYGLLLCNPYPISVIAPGVEVRDDVNGQGVYLANKDSTIKEPIYTADLLRKTVLDPKTGYQSHPSVVSGPYKLVSWDGKTAEFEINKYFKGDRKGKRPSIAKLVYTTADNDTQIEDLKAGKFDLLNKVMRKDVIDDGIKLTQEGGFTGEQYPRSGLSYISFACEKDTVSSKAVRQAIAWCLDRDKLTEEYTGGYGVTVDGYYGIGQFMYQLVTGGEEAPLREPLDYASQKEKDYYNKRLAAFNALNLSKLTRYAVNTEKAAALLAADGWKLNENGLREKKGVVLDLKMIIPEGNNIGDYMKENFLDNLEKVGIKVTIEILPMNQVLSQWYQQEERTADMILLASNFDLLFDPAGYFDQDGYWAYTCLKDNALYRYARTMITAEPGDALTYMKNWVSFQERFNEILPMIPIYSNYYYDFYTSSLTNYSISENITWSQAIVPATLAQ